jgi:nucleoprotein TPR
LNKKLAESKEKYEADYKLKLEQEKQIWLAETKTSNTNAAPSPVPLKASEATEETAPATPSTPSLKTPVTVSDGSNLSDAQVRELLSTNPTVKAILAGNLKKKVEAETQRLKEEQAKTIAEKLAEANQAAENAKTQAVYMAERKSALKINMADNRSKLANAKLDVVETAAKETPEKPVGEVWEVAKVAKPPPPPTVNTGMFPSRVLTVHANYVSKKRQVRQMEPLILKNPPK